MNFSNIYERNHSTGLISSVNSKHDKYKETQIKDIIVELPKSKDKEKIPKSARGRRLITYRKKQ